MSVARLIGLRAMAVVASVGVALGAAHPAVAVAAPGASTQLNATDTALLNGVRLAGLWEIPAGSLAAERGSRERVREIGAEIAKQHVELDELTVAAANKLGAELPADPTAEQQGWLDEMQAAQGARFDQIFVDRLRAAHGKIFPVIGAVRASTRNPEIRKLADQANIFVMNHMQMLESTGIVRYDQLAPPALPVDQDSSSWALAQANADMAPPVNSGILWVVLVVTLGLASFATARMVGWRGST